MLTKSRNKMSKQSAAWDKIAKRYDEVFGDEGDFSHKYIIYPATLNSISKISEKTFIDIGSGNGAFSKILAARGGNVVGIDSSPEMIHYSEKRCEPFSESVCFQLKDLEDGIKSPESAFDVAILLNVLNNIENFKQLINDTYKVLKKGGECIVVTPHPLFLYKSRSIKLANDSFYISEQIAEVRWPHLRNGHVPTTNSFIRSLESYMKAFLAAGFQLKLFEEPRPISEARDALNDSIATYERLIELQETPSFILLKWQKS